MLSDPHKRRLGVQPTAQMGRNNQCICRVLCTKADIGTGTCITFDAATPAASAIRRASSRVSKCAADRRPGSSSEPIPHYAAIFFAGSRFASRGGQLRNGLDPTLRRLRAPIRATTSARYGRGESSRETERVRHDLLHFFREIGVSGLLFHLASAFLICREFACMQPAAVLWIDLHQQGGSVAMTGERDPILLRDAVLASLRDDPGGSGL